MQVLRPRNRCADADKVWAMPEHVEVWGHCTGALGLRPAAPRAPRGSHVTGRVESSLKGLVIVGLIFRHPSLHAFVPSVTRLHECLNEECPRNCRPSPEMENKDGMTASFQGRQEQGWIGGQGRGPMG